MERADRAVSVSDRAGGGCVYSGLSGTCVSGGGREAHLPAGVADGIIVPAGGSSSFAVAPGPSGAVLRDVPHAASHVCDGHVRLCVSLVPDGRAGAGDLA